VDLDVVRSLDEVGSGDGSVGNKSEVSVDLSLDRMGERTGEWMRA